MLSKRLTQLFTLLSCNNTDIAHFAACTPSNISRIRSGGRKPKPTDKSIARLTEGIYCYADHENLLPILCELCKATGETREELIPAILPWLYDTQEIILPKAVKPQRKLTQEAKYYTGEKLDTVMSLLELSNARMARLINVDDSLISRFRSGIRSPRGNQQMSELLAQVLIERAEKQNRIRELAKLCQIPDSLLTNQTEGVPLFSAWLYDTNDEIDTTIIDRLLESFDSFSPVGKVPELDLKLFLEKNTRSDVYWGDEGLRQAVSRFLAETTHTGGELWLYSDEDMNWLFGNTAFLAQWSALMVACIKKGVKIKIIHNIDRGIEEMIEAIKNWLPLYMSGLIEPFACRRTRDIRFSHTFFLRPRAACIYGTHTGNAKGQKWYDYITETRKLAALETDYRKLLSVSEPLLKIYAEENGGSVFRSLPTKNSGKKQMLLSSLSISSMPESLFFRMLENQISDVVQQETILSTYQTRREQFWASLSDSEVYEFVRIPSDEELFQEKVKVNLGTELWKWELTYTPEEYGEHIAAIIELLAQKKNYHLFLLPELPFPNIQIVQQAEKTVIIRCQVPYIAFVFSDLLLCRAFENYFERLKKQYFLERSSARQMLKRFI